mmetsp:Transcript_39982/g.93980  ORF Transcript_39982/g.93980 Transcript_39982/m.93980 type:complete len:206 (+) Transcript_39982:754-1371(+)
MVVAWWRTTISASKRMHAFGFSPASTSTIPFRTCARLIFLSARVTDWPARAPLTASDLFMIPFSCTGMNLPCESGPRSRLLLSETCPRISVPPTTAPTPATAKVSSMWNCGSSLRVCVSSSFWDGRRLSQRWSNCMPSPVTLLILKIGAILAPLPMALAADTTSASVCTTSGIRLMPGALMMRVRSCIVFCSTCSGDMSILVMTK